MVKNRDLKLDNLRGLAIFLVVFGHVLVAALKIGFPHDIIFDYIFKAVYIFHMPVLIFISGYLSKIEEDTQVKAFRNILIPYIIFDAVFVIFRMVFFQDPAYKNLWFFPEIELWYLLSLYLWRTFLPSLAQVKHIILISILFSLFIGTIDIKNGFLSVARTVGFLPIFLLGFYFNDIKQKFTALTIKLHVPQADSLIRNKYLNILALIIILPISTYVVSYYHTGTGLKTAYHAMGFSNLEGMMLRLFILISATLIILILYNLMTSKRTIFTKFGKNSMAIYIFHIYLIVVLPPLVKLLGLKFLFKSFWTATLIIILLSVITTYLLSLDKVTDGMNFITRNFSSLVLKPVSRKKSTPEK